MSGTLEYLFISTASVKRTTTGEEILKKCSLNNFSDVLPLATSVQVSPLQSARVETLHHNSSLLVLAIKLPALIL